MGIDILSSFTDNGFDITSSFSSSLWSC